MPEFPLREESCRGEGKEDNSLKVMRQSGSDRKGKYLLIGGSGLEDRDTGGVVGEHQSKPPGSAVLTVRTEDCKWSLQ